MFYVISSFGHALIYMALNPLPIATIFIVYKTFNFIRIWIKSIFT